VGTITSSRTDQLQYMPQQATYNNGSVTVNRLFTGRWKKQNTKKSEQCWPNLSDQTTGKQLTQKTEYKNGIHICIITKALDITQSTAPYKRHTDVYV